MKTQRFGDSVPVGGLCEAVECKPSVPSGGLTEASYRGNFLCNPAFLLALRIVLGATFMHAGMMKLRDPAGFTASLASYPFLPPSLVWLAENQFPWLEVFLGFLLIGGLPKRAPAFGIMLLSLGFVMLHGQTMARGKSVDCGCFGPGHSMSPAAGLVLGSALFLGAGWLYLREARST